MNRIFKATATVLVLVTVMTMTACGRKDNGKKDNGETTATPTAALTGTPYEEEKIVVSVKGFPEEPVEGTVQDRDWQVSSFFEEYLFDAEGKCTAFEQEYVMRTSEDYEQTKQFLENVGVQNVTWSDSHESFRISSKRDNFTVADAIKDFENKLNGYIVRYEDGSTDVTNAPDEATAYAWVKERLGFTPDEIRGSLAVKAVNVDYILLRSEEATSIGDVDAYTAKLLEICTGVSKDGAIRYDTPVVSNAKTYALLSGESLYTMFAYYPNGEETYVMVRRLTDGFLEVTIQE